jgi:hypothetical protein
MKTDERTPRDREGESALQKYMYFRTIYNHDFAIKQMTQQEVDAGFSVILHRTAGPDAVFIAGAGYRIM